MLSQVLKWLFKGRYVNRPAPISLTFAEKNSNEFKNIGEIQLSEVPHTASIASFSRNLSTPDRGLQLA